MSNLPGDRELVERAVRNAMRHARPLQPRWGAVVDTFAVGSTTATELCRKYGLDPDEVKPEAPTNEEDIGQEECRS